MARIGIKDYLRVEGLTKTFSSTSVREKGSGKIVNQIKGAGIAYGQSGKYKNSHNDDDDKACAYQR